MSLFHTHPGSHPIGPRRLPVCSLGFLGCFALCPIRPNMCAGAGTSRCHPSEVNQPHLRHPLTTTHSRRGTTHLAQNHVDTHRCLTLTLDALHLYFSRSHCAGLESTPVLILPPRSNRPRLPPLICASPRATPDMTRLGELWSPEPSCSSGFADWPPSPRCRSKPLARCIGNQSWCGL
jgi:hypothetical protein